MFQEMVVLGWLFRLLVETTSVPFGMPWFDYCFWLLTLTSRHCRPWDAVVMAQVIRFLHLWEVQNEFSTTSFGSGPILGIASIYGVDQRTRTQSVS